ncbi:restriction endonuclease [Hymenobacter gummosus]|uniref:Restriction endonuclease n=1 Tax=Hymenobacter gummosus TaxID=1776032 RepID=A0A431U4M3_9BACT|nr:BsuBI/PstI family type II restriction endonuclease [Hymenobacter gummosus]RTQ50887.1 restriction endonuclease [Hymenobacter gummosus]
MNKKEQAQAILKALGLPKAQQNDRSALILLALAGVTEEADWADSRALSMGVVGRGESGKYPGIMRFINEYLAPVYDIRYEQNSREAFRKETLRQFIRAGVIDVNPESGGLSTNSQDFHYRLTAAVLPVLRAYGQPQWEDAVRDFVATQGSLLELYAGKRKSSLVLATLPDGMVLELSAGKHNELEKAILEQFRAEFARESQVVYVGDTAKKDLYKSEELLERLRLNCDTHDKIPDVVLYDEKQHWLFLIEAVTTHGPISPERLFQLKTWSAECDAGKIFVTAFLNQEAFRKYAAQIAWDTEVWIADAPPHLIHFNGDRFMGPRPETA